MICKIYHENDESMNVTVDIDVSLDQYKNSDQWFKDFVSEKLKEYISLFLEIILEKEVLESYISHAMAGEDVPHPYIDINF